MEHERRLGRPGRERRAPVGGGARGGRVVGDAERRHRALEGEEAGDQRARRVVEVGHEVVPVRRRASAQVDGEREAEAEGRRIACDDLRGRVEGDVATVLEDAVARRVAAEHQRSSVRGLDHERRELEQARRRGARVGRGERRLEVALARRQREREAQREPLDGRGEGGGAVARERVAEQRHGAPRRPVVDQHVRRSLDEDGALAARDVERAAIEVHRDPQIPLGEHHGRGVVDRPGGALGRVGRRSAAGGERGGEQGSERGATAVREHDPRSLPGSGGGRGP